MNFHQNLSRDSPNDFFLYFAYKPTPDSLFWWFVPSSL